MTANDFSRTTKGTEDSVRITVDVRPFDDWQGEAVDFYLHEICKEIEHGTFVTGKPIVVVCSRGTALTIAASQSLSKLLAHGVSIEIQELDS
jgi:rhodanese-related sulfurtransferase